MQGHAQGYKWVGRGMHACRCMHMGMKGQAQGWVVGVIQGCAAGVRMQQESVCKAANAGGSLLPSSEQRKFVVAGRGAT